MERKNIIPACDYSYVRQRWDQPRRVRVLGFGPLQVVSGSYPATSTRMTTGVRVAFCVRETGALTNVERTVEPRHIIESWADHEAAEERSAQAEGKAKSEARIWRAEWASILDDLRAAGIRFDASGRDDLNGVYHEHDRLTVHLSIAQAQRIVAALGFAQDFDPNAEGK